MFKLRMSSKTLRDFSIIFIGEFIAVTFLMYFGCMGLFDKDLNTTHAALAWGTALVSTIMVAGHITGAHCNPSVSLAAFINGLINRVELILYVIAQFIGAVFGYFLVHITLISNTESLSSVLRKWKNGFCCVYFHEGITIWQGMLAEFIATSILIFGCLSVWDPRNARWGDSVPIKLGLIVSSMVYSIGNLTGACLNPARAFGPALVNNKWDHIWCYFVATISSSILTAVFYQYMYLDKVQRARRKPVTPVLIEDPLLYDRKHSIEKSPHVDSQT